MQLFFTVFSDAGISEPPAGTVKFHLPLPSVYRWNARNPSVALLCDRTAAPAPSPKKTASLLVQSVLFENVSAPITQTLSYTPAGINCDETDIPKRKPLQTDEISNATALYASILSCTLAAVDGATLSGVEVATIIKSISSFFKPAFSIAFKAASEAKSLVNWSSLAIRLTFIPRFSSIQEAVVGKIWDKYSFIKILEGVY